MTYAAWFPRYSDDRGGVGALATWRRRVIVADTAELIHEGFPGGLVEPVELKTVDIREWTMLAGIGSIVQNTDNIAPREETIMSRFEVKEGMTLQEAVFTALGAASACWSDLAGAGEFESTRCKEIGEELVAAIRNGKLRDEATGLTPLVSRWQPLNERGQMFQDIEVTTLDPREADHG